MLSKNDLPGQCCMDISDAIIDIVKVILLSFMSSLFAVTNIQTFFQVMKDFISKVPSLQDISSERGRVCSLSTALVVICLNYKYSADHDLCKDHKLIQWLMVKDPSESDEIKSYFPDQLRQLVKLINGLLLQASVAEWFISLALTFILVGLNPVNGNIFAVPRALA